MADHSDSITLANVHQYLDGDGIFLPEEDHIQQSIRHEHGHDDGPTDHEIDAAIHNASNSLLAHGHEHGHGEHDSSSIDPLLQGHGHGHDDPNDSLIDPTLMGQHDQGPSGSNDAKPNTLADDPNVHRHRQAKRRLLSEDAVTNPASHLAPFVKPQRGPDTPHPEQLLFTSRMEFDHWLSGESSWCHYVQRRVTNPEKRADERLKARMRAHERTLAAMTPEEAATVPPLKRRRRNRTSAVVEKITFTCHHAGNYSSKHSENIPAARLRMNTKASVKCSCSSRIVLTEMEGGECQAMYYWRHEGHDPFASEELEAGRLPRSVDEWLNEQVRAGESVDTIRKKLDMTPEEKEAYIKMITEDPSRQEPGMPPALALSVRIKYPDIYNRFRKIRGAVKDNRPPRSTKGRPKSSRGAEFADQQSDPTGASHDTKHLFLQVVDDDDDRHHNAEASGSGSGTRARSMEEHDHDHGHEDEEPSMLQSEDVDHQFDQHLAQLASDGQLAEALLQLPQGPQGVIDDSTSADGGNGGHGQSIGVGVGVTMEGTALHGHDDEENLREAVLRMARAERDDWDSIVQP